jgi:predicted cupin superfamily sugar epimerase
MTADDVIRLLALKPHPEGGFYRETFRDSLGPDGRSHSTAIYYLLRAGDAPRWHRVDSAEVWHWYLGSALQLSICDSTMRRVVLGPRLDAGERLQAVVPAGKWQRAMPLGEYTLVGCTVAPGFEFSGFELAPLGWAPE